MIRYDIIDGLPVRMVQVCNCGRRPQAPDWDQCIGCGKTAAENPRKWIPAQPPSLLR